jgi:hypothetical protein
MPVAVLPRSGVSPHSPQPAPPERQYSFTDFQIAHPTDPPPGNKLDSEYDRSNQAIEDVINWVSVSLNTDGSLKYPTMPPPGSPPPGTMSQAEIATVRPLVDEAKAAAEKAIFLAKQADDAARAAQAQNAHAHDAAERVATALADGSSVAREAAASAAKAAISASDADNSAKDTAGDVALCEDYSLVTQAWAEHMPDTIPPTVLAVMNVTGDHWSSRWWANHASVIVSTAESNLTTLGNYWYNQIITVGEGYVSELEQDYYNYFGSLQTLYLGAAYYPPETDSLGNPVAMGAMYYNIALEAAYIWNGLSWVPLIGYAPPDVARYIYVATAGQTVFTGPDRDGNSLTYDPANKQRIQVFRQKLLLTPTNDYSDTVPNQITLVTGASAGDIVQIFVTIVPTVTLSWATVKVDTHTWTTTGGVIRDSHGNAIVPATASDILVSVNGVWQGAGTDYTVVSSTLTFIPAIEVDALVFAIVVKPTVTSAAHAITPLVTTSWVFNGTNVTFPLVGSSGPITTTAVNLLISLNGTWLNAGVDYTVTGTNVTFTVPPEADGALVFGFSGLPA